MKFGVKHLRIVMDTLINVFIIFTFLVLFSFFYVRPTKTRAIQREFKKAVVDGINVMNPMAIHHLLPDPMIDALECAFDTPDPLTRSTNLALLALALSVSCCLGTVIIVIALFAHRFKLELQLLDIVSKNMWSFIMVAIIEIIFFFAVGRDYVVTPPSHLADTVVRALRRDDRNARPHRDINCADVWPCVTDRNMRISGACFGAIFSISIVFMCIGPSVDLRGRAYERTGS